MSWGPGKPSWKKGSPSWILEVLARWTELRKAILQRRTQFYHWSISCGGGLAAVVVVQICNPMDCSPGQAALSMEFPSASNYQSAPFPFPRESSWPRDWNWDSSKYCKQILYWVQAMKEASVSIRDRASKKCLKILLYTFSIATITNYHKRSSWTIQIHDFPVLNALEVWHECHWPN